MCECVYLRVRVCHEYKNSVGQEASSLVKETRLSFSHDEDTRTCKWRGVVSSVYKKKIESPVIVHNF